MRYLLAMLACMFSLIAGEKPIIVMETSEGTIELALMPDIAPKACKNMMELTESGKYNGTTFHRIIPKFMIQGGDYERGNGMGGKSCWGRPFEDECNSKVKFNKPGLLAMANAGPNTNGSQFFITTAQTPHLQGKHTIFGEVTSGYDVIKKIEALGSQSGRTSKTVKIIKMTVKQ